MYLNRYCIAKKKSYFFIYKREVVLCIFSIKSYFYLTNTFHDNLFKQLDMCVRLDVPYHQVRLVYTEEAVETTLNCIKTARSATVTQNSYVNIFVKQKNDAVTKCILFHSVERSLISIL